VLALYAASTDAIAVRGYAPNAFFALGLLVVVTTLVKGRRFGLFSVAVVAATLFGVSLLHRQGLVLREPIWEVYSDSSRLSVMFRVTVIFALVVLTVVVGISYLVEHSEGLVRVKQRSLTLLERAQAERARRASELVEREASFRKAQEMEILGRLSGSVAHDFNNALLVILCALDDLGEAQNHAGRFDEAAHRGVSVRSSNGSCSRLLGIHPEEVSLPLELVDDFLAKPFSGDVLAQRIGQLLPPREV
jgi:signal transduction histidine kinase